MPTHGYNFEYRTLNIKAMLQVSVYQKYTMDLFHFKSSNVEYLIICDEVLTSNGERTLVSPCVSPNISLRGSAALGIKRLRQEVALVIEVILDKF